MSSFSTKINHLLHPVLGEIWCLHRVVAERSRFKSNRELEITPDYLEQLIENKRQEGYRFIPIDKLLNSDKSWLYQKQINISFDDGFKDLYTTAYPILKYHKIPFTLYLSTGFPEGTVDVWWYDLEKIGFSCAEFETILQKIFEENAPLSETMHRITGYQNQEAYDFLLTWEEIKDMMKSGLCTIGSHTVSHAALTKIDSGTCFKEITHSKQTIENHLGVSVQHFSYPHSMLNRTIQQSVIAAGYKSAALGYGGKIRKGFDSFSIPRSFIRQP